MSAVFPVFMLLALTTLLAYLRANLIIWTGVFAVAFLTWGWLFGTPLLAWLIFLPVAIVLNMKLLRRLLVSRRLLNWFRKVLPPMSDTEQEALEAGTVWWDADLFSGRPDWKKLLAIPAPSLSEEEQAFIDGPVEELCGMLDDWEITHERNDLPPEVWEFIKKNKFFGMIIPKEYGGREFSALANSTVVMKIATRSMSAGVTVMVPNSLGPGELIMHYGTEEQRKHYLPRLAIGEEIPCFALTNLHAGSDAGAMPDSGVVCKGEHNGKEVLGFRASWDKRYITLAPIATVLGLAFKAYDPDGLLGDKEELGITCALIPTATPGVEIGARHNPLNAAFPNGPTRGKDVFIPFDWVIGGEKWIGQGWRMLMNCLSAGRAISLPALGTGSGKLASRATGAYARIRKQFRVPIASFEGVEEALTRIAGYTYRMDAARRMTAGAIALGESPSVLSAILKYHCTEGMRQVINDSMDVHGGRGVILGPNNYVGRIYQTIPVSITVEGANILTRSMIIFGQGAIRCHPYLLKELEAAAHPDNDRGVELFDAALFAHVGYTISNSTRAFVDGVTGSLLVSAPNTPLRYYYRQFSRMSAAFAFLADVALLILGGEMKRREKLSGRYGDVLSHLYMGSATLKRFEDTGLPDADLPLAEWSCQDSLFTMQTKLEEILENFPLPWFGSLLKWVVFPLGRPYRKPDDRLGAKVADILTTPSEARDRLTDGIYFKENMDDIVGRLDVVLKKVLETEPLEEKLQAGLGIKLAAANYLKSVEQGLSKGVIDDIEAKLLTETFNAVETIIAVDEFSADTSQKSDQLKSANA